MIDSPKHCLEETSFPSPFFPFTTDWKLPPHAPLTHQLRDSQQRCPVIGHHHTKRRNWGRVRKEMEKIRRNERSGVPLLHQHSFLLMFIFSSTHPLPTPECLPSFALPSPPSSPLFHTTDPAPWKFFLHLLSISHQALLSLFSEWRPLPIQPKQTLLISTRRQSAPFLKGGICLPPHGNSKPDFTEKHLYVWRVGSTFLLTTFTFQCFGEWTLEPIENFFFFLEWKDCTFYKNSLINQL